MSLGEARLPSRLPLLSLSQGCDHDADQARPNTGILCATAPCLDIDIEDPDAAAAVEALVRERYEERGTICVRLIQPTLPAMSRRNDGCASSTTAPGSLMMTVGQLAQRRWAGGRLTSSAATELSPLRG